MSELIKDHYEKLLLAAACGAVVVGGVWMARQQASLALVQAEPERPVFTGGGPALIAASPETPGGTWSKPPAQSQGSGWLYEVFTPPVIYYHSAARSFAVTPPAYAAGAAETVFGLELLAVKLAPYRLQLAGYFGARGDYLAAFVSSEVPQTLLGRAGRHFPELGLTLKSLAVRKVPVEADGTGPAFDIAAFAVLHDEQTNTEVVLDSRHAKLTDTPLAVFQEPDGQGRPRELHEGDTFKDGEGTYRIQRIQLYPPEVVVARTTPGLPVPETKILRPVGKESNEVAGKAPRLRPSVTSSSTGLAAQDR